MPDVSGVTVVSNACAFYHCARVCGRAERPAFPAPSFERAKGSWQTPDASRRGNAKVYPGVIASVSEAIHIAFTPSFRDGSKDQTRNLEIPGLVLAHHPGMTVVVVSKKSNPHPGKDPS